VYQSPVTLERLMRVSTDRVQGALQSENPNEKLIASRLVQSPAAFRAWESEHAGMMREVANSGARRTQTAVLKKAAFRLIHRKALFEYLRDERIRGNWRQRTIEHFHPAQDYAQSVVAEHSLYLRKACSFLCTSHVGTQIVRDPGFFDPMERYQELYAEYFQIFCSTYFSGDSAGLELQSALLPMLKHQLEECRMAIMNPRAAAEWLKREGELRESTGDTARLRRLGEINPSTR
jgi:hypothetical protein